MKANLTVALLALLSFGCARFSTIQTDTRYDEAGNKATTITTKAQAWTFFQADSKLANWKAEQSEGSQGAEVGNLEQSSSGTNITQTIKEVLVEISDRL